MPEIVANVACPIHDSFRVQQVGGMFDVPLSRRAIQQFRVAIPDDFQQKDWRIGLIVGPSGSGKSTIARTMFGESLYQCREWPRERAVIDGLGNRPIKEITALFTAVGFGSPPSWIKPYHVLSNGEQFRCDLARALAASSETGGLVAFDEFTSVVDRNVARVASAAIARGMRRGQIAGRFVAVTCHYDVTEWLQPDWVLDMATSRFQWRCLPRPAIELTVFRCERRAWSMFARHHYLSGALSAVVWCYMALWEDHPVTFCAVAPLMGKKNRRRISRIVTLPDYQGIGVGMAVTEAVAELQFEQGYRVNLTASHPAVLAHCGRSRRWRTISVKKTGSRGSGKYRGSAGRAVVSFEFTGSRKDDAVADSSSAPHGSSAVPSSQES